MFIPLLVPEEGSVGISSSERTLSPGLELSTTQKKMISNTAHVFALVLGTVGFLPAGAQAWGAFGHETVAYVATNFVAASTKTYFQSLLGDTSADYLATVSTWADSYRTTTAGKFSAPYHFIDAQDSPPSSCGVDYDRDCGSGGCVISAINNYVSASIMPEWDESLRQTSGLNWSIVDHDPA